MLLLFWFVAGAVFAEDPAPLEGTKDERETALHVLNRLAYGPAPGDIGQVVRMGPQQWIARQLQPESIPLPEALTARLAALSTVQMPAGAVLGQFQAAQQAVRGEEEGAKEQRRAVVARIAQETAEARLLRAVASPRQLEEVMVDFWFNHFNVYAGKGQDRALVASYERDAIRPYAMGNFRALLGATARHPAMLFYLDNWVSKAGGLNENYARELMELHTLGVDGGYTQRDVLALARMLTGWTYAPRRLADSNETFYFDARRHDNGVKQWLGRTVTAAGQAEGEMALDILAAHPATAHHIAYKLAQYFVQDQPPPALVDRLAQRFTETNGDIRSVLQTLFASSEFMAPAARGAKFKTPYQYVVSALRAAGAPADSSKAALAALNRLGMPLYGCQTPDGYKNTQQAWLNPDALAMRIGYAVLLGKDADTAALRTALGPAITPATWSTVDTGAPRVQAALLLGSPDFMEH
ncbi:DUF1800 domain-containing protein [Pseudoduganella ginsengisoli]|uniref:DUF1800 family protein n=1 Tax=Pseudoduganella ginsengisoli TaxID=1462440 RepID=A0A6L6PT74_9BURK|nr:DUF1800 domain-containing protein [Pseudoduganella ginsengisoli]MTW00723.1 DUF1800 family protein [Pseudoduganella ginsengisoli]